MPLSTHTLPLLWALQGVWWNRHANAWELSPDIKCMLHLLTELHKAVRSQPLEVGERTCELSAYCALQYLTTSRDLPVILDIRPLIPADCYKQMFNVRCDEDRVIVRNIMFTRSNRSSRAGFYIEQFSHDGSQWG